MSTFALLETFFTLLTIHHLHSALGTSVLVSPLVGVLADKSSNRQVPFLAGLAALLAATVMLAFGRTLAVLVVAKILQGLSAATVWVVGLALVLDTVGPDNLGKTIVRGCGQSAFSRLRSHLNRSATHRAPSSVPSRLANC